MSEPTTPNPIDEDVLDFAQKIFGYVRVGNSEALAPLLQQGLPANLRNHKGDSLLMLASYHGHADCARYCWTTAPIPSSATTAASCP